MVKHYHMDKTKKFTFKDFLERYPNDDACLEAIFKIRYGDLECCPKCAVANAKFYKMKNRRCYACGECGYHIYPTAGTIMYSSQTKLTSWFYAIYLFTVSKNGVSAKELQRQLGVTYKCAWRIGHKIRQMMAKDESKLSGKVEIDESLIGGKGEGKRGWGAENKTCMFGMMQRDGNVKTIMVDSRHRNVLIPLISKHVVEGSTIYSDEFRVYRVLVTYGYNHQSVIHSKYQWTNGDCHTNSIEGYWSNLKKAILGTHTFVSKKWLQSYLNEFDFRHNHRKEKNVFDVMLSKLIR